MTSTSTGEQSIFSDVASVFVMHNGAWQSVDGGVSRVNVCHNFSTQAFRVLALSSERKVKGIIFFFFFFFFQIILPQPTFIQYVVNMWISSQVHPELLNEACLALLDTSSGAALALNFAHEQACTKFLSTWRASMSLNNRPAAATSVQPRPGVRASVHPSASPAAAPVTTSAPGAAPGLAPAAAPRRSSATPAPAPKINAKQRLALAHDAEIDDDASPISFNRAVTRLEEGLKAVLTAAHNSVSNPSYNYDNRAEAAVQYLHVAMRSLIKLFVSKIVARRKVKEAQSTKDGATADKGVIERTMRLTYYEIMNTPTRGVTEEFTLKAAVGIRRRLVLRILALRLKDDFVGTLYIGQQMLSAMNAVKLIDPKNTAPATQEGTCLLQLCATMLALTKQLTRVADGIANFGNISRDDDYNQIVQDADDDAMTQAFWTECAQNEFPEGAKAYTLNQLVLKLTDDNSYDRKFLETFTTTYQSFAPPGLLLQKLMERYQVPPTALDDKRRTAIQLRVAVALKYWCEKYFSHFDETLLQSLASFLTDYLVKDGHVAMANALYAFIMNKIKERDEERAVAFRVPATIYSQRHKENPHVDALADGLLVRGRRAEDRRDRDDDRLRVVPPGAGARAAQPGVEQPQAQVARAQPARDGGALDGAVVLDRDVHSRADEARAARAHAREVHHVWRDAAPAQQLPGADGDAGRPQSGADSPHEESLVARVEEAAQGVGRAERPDVVGQRVQGVSRGARRVAPAGDSVRRRAPDRSVLQGGRQSGQHRRPDQLPQARAGVRVDRAHSALSAGAVRV
jgi:hypothetical protein